MKKILFFLFFSTLAISMYSQYGSIIGDQIVCPGQIYKYKIYFARTIDTDNSSLYLHASGGEFSNGSENITLYVYKGTTDIEVAVKWKDIGMSTSISANHSLSGTSISRDIYITSANKTKSTDYGNYGFTSSPIKPVNNIIKIPYGVSSNLSMSVNFSTNIFYRPIKVAVPDIYKTTVVR